MAQLRGGRLGGAAGYGGAGGRAGSAGASRLPRRRPSVRSGAPAAPSAN